MAFDTLGAPIGRKPRAGALVMGGRGRLATAGLSALLLTALAVGPVLADKELGDRGQVGQHSLRDTHSKPGAECRYKGNLASPGGSYSYVGKLKYIDVRPPKVRAISGTQQVGWRFIVQRAKGFGTWRTTYTSPIQKKSATAGRNALFTHMGIKVRVPPRSSSPDAGPSFNYRVLVKMYWYRPNGTTQGTAKHEVEFYYIVHGGWGLGGVDGAQPFPCGGWETFIYF